MLIPKLISGFDVIQSFNTSNILKSNIMFQLKSRKVDLAYKPLLHLFHYTEKEMTEQIE